MYYLDYIFGISVFLISVFILYKKLKKETQKGKCALCSTSNNCKTIDMK